MDFINKLIKKGIFGLLLVFSFFAFTEGMRIDAATCDAPVLNDGDKYLVLNTKSAWKDSGVTITCGGTQQNNVWVSVNGKAPELAVNGVGVADKYITSPGFYKIKYYVVDNDQNELTSITRQIRVLPYNLNDARNIWSGEVEKVNTSSNDGFNKIIDFKLGNNKKGYLGVGSFGNVGYVVAFNGRGEFLWSSSFGEVEIDGNVPEITNLEIKDIVLASEAEGIYYISGQYQSKTRGGVVGFVKPIDLNDVDTGGINESYGTIKELYYSDGEDTFMLNAVNRMSLSQDSKYLFVVGYRNNERQTKTGVVARITLDESMNLGDVKYFQNNMDSEYNGIVSENGKVVVVGSTSISGYPGATGGSLLVCDNETLNCEDKGSYLYLNNNLASTTITNFNDIVSHGTKYVVVGDSRIDRVNGLSTSINSGVEDALIVLLDEEFAVEDVQLRGSSSKDSLKSIKQISDNSFIAVGDKAGLGFYVTIDVVGDNFNQLQTLENTISGNSTVELKNAFVQKSLYGEMQYVFVGASQAITIEDMIIGNKGNNDAVMFIVDVTDFNNYEDINVEKNTVMCSDGISVSCSGDLVNEIYWLVYGEKKIGFPYQVVISSSELKQYITYHDFTDYEYDDQDNIVSKNSSNGFVNAQGIKFIIGRIINITENPVAPNIKIGEMGIDKWYLYSRPQMVGSNIGGFERENLWTEYYYPVDNNIEKGDGTYYKIASTGTFEEDTNTSKKYTYANYVKLPSEPQSTSVAFQSTEKITAKDTGFAILQEFTRIAVVNKKYSSTSGVTVFQGEVASLSTQNYYFIYYIDLKFSDGVTCGTSNGQLVGNCTNYTGYAFASLNRIKTIANLIVEKYNYFVSQSNTRFNPGGNVSLPSEAGGYREEMTTVRYVQGLSISLENSNQYLVVAYRKAENGKISEDVSSEFVTGRKGSVTFAKGGDFEGEGEYTVKYCYNYGLLKEHCGQSATFVVDRTAPIINYSLKIGEKGIVDRSVDPADPTKIKGNMDVKGIVDIDPYAYTIVDGKKYYLSCNKVVDSATCSAEITSYVTREFKYDPKNPDKVHNIHVYDRAGNVINFYFKIGTAMPTVSVKNDTNGESFTLKIEFFEKNAIDSFIIDYTASENCTDEKLCTNPDILQTKIMNYIDALTYLNNLELIKKENDEGYDISETIKPFIELVFTISSPQANDTIVGGVNIPEVEKNNETGEYVIKDDVLYPISKGLYVFVLADEFLNVDNDANNYGGLGLSKAELYTYIEKDENYEESEDLFASNAQNKKIPKTAEEAGDIVSDNIFIAETPSTYAFVDKLPTDGSLKNGFDETMFFTNQFIYIKFKANQFGIIQIKQATSLNNVSNIVNSECITTIYGKNIDVDELSDKCGALIELSNISTATEIFNQKGIYFVSAVDGYYYMVFTREGTYSVTSSVYAKITASGQQASIVAFPVKHTFTIDKTSPEISFDFVCENEKVNCKGDKSTYSLSDFVFNDSSTAKVNIGNYNLRLKFNKEVLFTDGSEVVENRLMVIKYNKGTYNAYEYAGENSIVIDNQYGTIYDLDPSDDVFDGQGNVILDTNLSTEEYILFHNSGTYVVTFVDAAGNETTFRFTIDESKPGISISDPDNIGFSQYRQYAEAQITINEGTLTGETALTIKYFFEGEDEKEINISNNQDGTCEISVGSGLIKEGAKCVVTDNNGIKGLSVTFVIEINKTERLSDSRRLTVVATDYFGNSKTMGQGFEFDNYAPYIYYDSQYNPIKIFGSNVSNDDRERMLSTVADSTLGAFVCDSPDLAKFNLNGIIICRDTPEKPDKDNNVVINAYEAYKAANNNYVLENGKYNAKKDGAYIDVNTIIYKKNYTQVDSVSRLTSLVNENVPIYIAYSPVIVYDPLYPANYELIDPNIEYYYEAQTVDGEGNPTTVMTVVDIKEMYTATRFAGYTDITNCGNNAECVLYRMYKDKGYFTQNSISFYKDSISEASKVSEEEVEIIKEKLEAGTLQNYSKYYYHIQNDFSVDNDFSDNYLKALTLENSCVKANGNACVMVEPNRIKLYDYNTNVFEYYNIINKAETNKASIKEGVDGATSHIYSIVIGGTTYPTVLDDRIWRIALDSDGNEISFGFGLASNLGRPIIFRAKDGATNLSANQLETVIIIKDNTAPTVQKVNSVKYEEISKDLAKAQDFAKVVKYYKVLDTSQITCSATDAVYYTYDSTKGYYVSTICGDWKENEQYYVAVDEYEPYDALVEYPDGTKYYKATINDLKDNYLTKDNFIISFNEPIYRVECSYYLFDVSTNTGIEKQCSIQNTEFNYRENKTSFTLVYEEERENYYVNYKITAYDFSENLVTVNTLFIDREKPVLYFHDNVTKVDEVEVNYISNNNETKYDATYLDNAYSNDIYSVDKINTRINEIGATAQINNTLKYQVAFYKFNYNVITANNYVKSGNSFVPVSESDVGQLKDENTKYYVLIKNTGNYVLKGNTGQGTGLNSTCEVGEYCYIEDSYNYYPSLLSDSRYWVALDKGMAIPNNKIGVYKIEYRVQDHSENISDILIKTVYIVDTTTPTLKLNGEESRDLYGYHRKVTITFENENQGVMHDYTCKETILTCTLPTEIFTPASDKFTRSETVSTQGKTEKSFTGPGIYKIYFFDLGSYVETNICDGSGNCSDTMMTLKYNYREYQFVIDVTPPEFYVTAIVENNKLYYEVSLTQEETLYCVKGPRNGDSLYFSDNRTNCIEYLSGDPETTVSENGKIIKHQIFNQNKERIYEVIYTKLDPYAQKYFYNTYYYKQGDTFRNYLMGAAYDEDNVYVITSMKLFFREDGKYIIQAKDKAGNFAGRTTSGQNFEGSQYIDVDSKLVKSEFIIDNTAPTNNQITNSPTGINYWFSVPSNIITNQNIDRIKNLVKDNEKYYNIFSSNLNNSFFYAFATKTEAINYLTTIYTNHINGQSDNNCTVKGFTGFNYSYYDASTGTMKQNCFVGTQEKTNKAVALDQVIKTFDNLVFPTFSGSVLFDNIEIKQLACDENLTSNCKENKNMYKYIYLKLTDGDPIITETCADGDTCIKVNVRIIKNVTSQNYVHFDLGLDNAIDPDSKVVRVYYSTLTSGTSQYPNSPFEESKTISLNNKTYYVFEERDSTIIYSNYWGSAKDVEHYNTTYYAVYVDDNKPISVYYENDDGKSSNNLILTDEYGNGYGNDKTNHDKYNLIIKNNGDPDFLVKYDIHELWDDKGNLIEVYSYLRLMIDNVYYNINDYINDYRKEGNNYYFTIPLVNIHNKDLQERNVNVYFFDRAGNSTNFTLSHTKQAPTVELSWSEDKTKINIEVEESHISKLEKDSFKIYYSPDGVTYSEEAAKNIRNAIMCEDNFTGYEASCISKDGKNVYRLTLTDLEGLYGFFKIVLADDHENNNYDNPVEFIYNPADLTINYTNSNIKYINYAMDSENVRMLSNNNLQVEWNNELNYIIVYKIQGENFVEVCNSENMENSGTVLCKIGNDMNYVVAERDSGKYIKSTLQYVDEGLYEIKIVNRLSVKINNRCVDGDGVKEDCKPIKTYSSSICSWENNADYCAEGLQIIDKIVSKTYDGQSYSRFEIDKTVPNIDISQFYVNLPTGVGSFEDNATYTNAEVTIQWDETFVQLTYTCEYVDEGVKESCRGNSTGYLNENKKFTFKVENRLSTKYTFWFEDYAGNSTVANKLSFTINVVLPEFNVYELSSEGILLDNKLVVEETKIKNNAKLLCYVNGEITNCNIYDVKLYRYSVNGYKLVTSNDPTTVSENFENKYKFVVSIKNTVTGYVYENLNQEFTFTIDKVAPNITVEGNKDALWGIYTGEVRVLLDSNGTGKIYNNCIVTGENELGDKTYDCQNVLVNEFTSNHTLTETGIYKVVAVDEIGNVTEGNLIKYITIDNDIPEISISAKTTYLDYELSENGYTNAEKVIVQSVDQNKGNDYSEQSYIMYRRKNADGTYTEWITHTASILEITEEGFYEVKPVDLVGNEGLERHFIIYRQQPKYYVYVGNKSTPNTQNDILTEDALVTWDEPNSELEAPIIKVSVNGKAYTKRDPLTETGEYVFTFVDLAGNVTTHKLTINKSEKICLNNVLITPNKRFLAPINDVKFSGGQGYKYKENDVIILATPTNYYGNNETCSTNNVLSYKTLTNDEETYLVLNKGTADHINANQNVKLSVPGEISEMVQELGGYVYIFIVDLDVAKKDLGFKIGENFFTKDPLGWSLIFIAGIGVIYVGLKVFVFKKKVRVLK